jgi:hypothetical protein
VRARVLGGVALLALLGLAAATGTILYLQSQGIAPRALAPYVAKRSSGHNPFIVGTGTWLHDTLVHLDRGELPPSDVAPALTIGAQPGPAPGGQGQQRPPHLVSTSIELRSAMAGALPGDVITLLPGRYRFQGGGASASRPGTSEAPITVRADKPETVFIEFDTTEGFVVSGPYWRFENLHIQGVCAQHSDCEHAFHVVGGAHHFAAVNNVILDFNAHFKINGAGGRFPDSGVIESNTLGNTAARNTLNPVAPIDLVAASDWSIRANLISDFIKGDGDRISYGAFAKGAGARTVFERNIVLCERRLRGRPGQRVGLSLGGGATGKPFCRDGKCITEQEQAVIRSNLIASCSDVGLYLNSAAATKVSNNTLVDTAGVQVRFPESSADLDGNLVDGAIHSRNGGIVRLGDNLTAPIGYAYAGYHPLRRLFKDPEQFDFRWSGTVPRVAGTAGAIDLCGGAHRTSTSYGAFEDFSDCLRRD